MEDLNKNLEVANLLKELMHSLKRMIRCEYKDDNITAPQGMLLGMLAHHGEMKISDLSEKLQLSNSTVSGILDRLEKLGLVQRTRSMEDRRVVYVDITPEYRKKAGNRFKEIEKNIELKMNKATSEEIDKLLDGLNILKKLLD